MASSGTKEHNGLFDEPNGKSLFKEVINRIYPVDRSDSIDFLCFLQISNAKTAIDEHYYRIDVIERNLAQKEMTFEER